MEQEIKSFTEKYNKTQEKISQLTQAFKNLQTLEKDAQFSKTDESKKEITSIFDGSKTIYRTSTDGKNVMHFTSLSDVKDYLDK